jgi:3-hydroxyacyl-[acyl-carrier-protein] dehydratase
MKEIGVPTEPVTVDVEQIMEMIPHRYPMLLIDKVVNLISGDSATGIKNVTINEPHFVGHFPQRPVMPGVMIVESMAQTAAVLVVHTLGWEDTGDRLVYFMSIENAHFRKPVVPGDRMHVHVVKSHSRGKVWKLEGRCEVDGVLVADAKFTAMITDQR